MDSFPCASRASPSVKQTNEETIHILSFPSFSRRKWKTTKRLSSGKPQQSTTTASRLSSGKANARARRRTATWPSWRARRAASGRRGRRRSSSTSTASRRYPSSPHTLGICLSRRRWSRHPAFLTFADLSQRERKREQLAKIRVQFEKDKQRIAKMKESRKFKPF